MDSEENQKSINLNFKSNTDLESDLKSNNNANLNDNTNADVKFENYNLSTELLRGIYGMGFETPSATQKLMIPIIMEGKDCLIQANSGTGKTAGFSISLLNKIDVNEPTIQGIVIANTIELATQLYDVMKSIGSYMNVNFVKCVGGHNVRDKLIYPNNATVLIGTPGKMNDVITKNVIKSQECNIKIVIIDEFDKTLHRDFVPIIQSIFKEVVHNHTQIVLVSATISDEVLNLTKVFLIDPNIVTLKNEDVTLEGIKQFYVNLERDEHKFDTILDLYKSNIIGQCIIFVNSKNKCNDLEYKFRINDFVVGCSHGGMDRLDREKIMENFKKGDIRILLTTDLISRGIDVQTVSLVINYDVPYDCAEYTHRIGRCSRYGRKGVAINLVGNSHDTTNLNKICDHYSIKMDELPLNYADII